MISVLIVDDEPQRARVTRTIVENVIGNNGTIAAATCVGEALRILEGTQFDVMVLDIRLPMAHGSHVADLGGLRLLERIDEDPRIVHPTHVIGLTAYADTLDEITPEFRRRAFAIYFSEDQGQPWRLALQHLLQRLVDSAKQAPHSAHLKADLAILATTDDEWKCLCDRYSNQWKGYPVYRDPNYYYSMKFATPRGELEVVFSRSFHMGQANAAVASMRLASHFHPHVLTMIGVCAGFPGRTNFGDVIVADPCWDYGLGKFVGGEEHDLKFDVEPYQFRLHERIHADFKNFENLEASQDILSKNKVLVGPFGTGSAVIASKYMRDKFIAPQHRKLLGFDMEACAVFCSAQQAFPRVTPVVIKGVSDGGSDDKDDSEKDLACINSIKVLEVWIRTCFHKFKDEFTA